MNGECIMSLRTTLAAAAALLAIGAAPAFAQSGGAGGDSNINNFVRQSPNGMQPQSNGIPTIVDNRDGQPVIQYRGAQPRAEGVEDGRVPRIVDNREGQPVISYGADQTLNPVRGARPSRAARQAAANAPMASAPLLGRARTALQRGQFAAAAANLEAVETRMLNEQGGPGQNATLRSVSEARAAAARRDRAGAIRALDAASSSMTRAG
jgi:thioredoxin-like negative regulator of GroEL